MSPFFNKEPQCYAKNVYWTNSKVVLGFINNDAKIYQTVVVNRVQEIRNISKVNQLNYVPTKDNPDFTSR